MDSSIYAKRKRRHEIRESVQEWASGLRLCRAWLDGNAMEVNALDSWESVRLQRPVYPLSKLALGAEGEKVQATKMAKVLILRLCHLRL